MISYFGHTLAPRFARMARLHCGTTYNTEGAAVPNKEEERERGERKREREIEGESV